MVIPRTLMMAGATLACALGIGYLMQPEATQSVGVAPVLPQEPDQTLVLENVSLTSAGQLGPVDTPLVDLQAKPAPTCDVTVSSVARPKAMVELTVLAPCQSSNRVTVHHHGMMFSEILDASGTLTVTVPALAEHAVYIIDTDQSKGAVTTQLVKDFDSVDRIVLQWQGNSGFELHAREFGAEYGAKGHVWRDAKTAGEGSVHRLGNEGLLAPRLVEIYTFPRSESKKTGTVALTVEAEVTQINCGRDIAAQTLELRDGRLRTRDVVLNMPGCDASGDFLVLNNLVQNLTIAQN